MTDILDDATMSDGPQRTDPRARKIAEFKIAAKDHLGEEAKYGEDKLEQAYTHHLTAMYYSGLVDICEHPKIVCENETILHEIQELAMNDRLKNCGYDDCTKTSFFEVKDDSHVGRFVTLMRDDGEIEMIVRRQPPPHCTVI